MREQWSETIAGLAVIAVAAVFLVYSLSVGGVSRDGARYDVTARFGEVGSLAPGADVKVAGVKVGTVTDIRLDPKNFLAVARLSLNKNVKLPSDSTAKIASDSLLGGAHIAIAPGGAPDDLKQGAEIQNTQGSIDLLGLIGQFIEKPAAGAAASASPAATAGNSAAALPDY